MMPRAAEPGFVDDVPEVLEALIGEGGSQRSILVAEVVADDLDGVMLGERVPFGRSKRRDLWIGDLRENGGGSEPNEAILFSYLIDRTLRRYAYVEARSAHLSVTSLTGKRLDKDVFDADELAMQRRTADGRLCRRNMPPEGLMTRQLRYTPVYRGRLAV